MNEHAVQLVKSARTLVERWRADSYGGDLEQVNEHIELLAYSLHGIGLSADQVSESYAPDRNIVGLKELTDTIRLVGTAVVAAMQGIRIEIRYTAGERRNPPADVVERQRQLDRCIDALLISAKDIHVDPNG